MAFIKHHKHHLGAFVILIIIAVISGYFAFSDRIQDTHNTTQDIGDKIQNADNRIQTSDNTIQDTSNPPATPERSDGGRSKIQTDTKNQNTNDTPPTTLSTTTTISTSSPPEIEQLINPVIFRIDDRDYPTKFTSSTTVLDLMIQLKSENKLSFSGKEYSGMGFFVDEINEVKNDNLAGKYWIYYVNGQSAQVGISNYVLKPNDLIEWKYGNTNL